MLDPLTVKVYKVDHMSDKAVLFKYTHFVMFTFNRME